MKVFKSLRLAQEFAESAIKLRSKVPLIFEVMLDNETRKLFGNLIWLVQDKTLPDRLITLHCQYESRTVGKFTVIRCIFDNLSEEVRREKGILEMNRPALRTKSPSILIHKEDNEAYVISNLITSTTTSSFNKLIFSCEEVFLMEISAKEKDSPAHKEEITKRIVIGNHDSWICGRILSTIENQQEQVLISPPDFMSINSIFKNSNYLDDDSFDQYVRSTFARTVENENIEFLGSYSIEDKYNAYCLSRNLNKNLSLSIEKALLAYRRPTQTKKEAEDILKQDGRIREYFISTEDRSEDVVNIEVITHPLKVKDVETGKIISTTGFVISSSLTQLISVSSDEKKNKNKVKFYPGVVVLGSRLSYPSSVVLFGSHLEKVLKLHYLGRLAEIIILVIDIISSCKTTSGTREAVIHSLRQRSR